MKKLNLIFVFLFVLAFQANAQFSPDKKAEKGLEALDEGDYNKAFKNFEKSDENDNVVGTYYLGKLYLIGKGTAKNEAKGIELYKKASAKGYSYASNALAVHYYGERSYTEALKYGQMAAKDSIIQSLTLLGHCYFYGFGTDINYRKAIDLYTVVASKYVQDNFDDGFFIKSAMAQLAYSIEKGIITGIENANDLTVKRYLFAASETRKQYSQNNNADQMNYLLNSMKGNVQVVKGNVFAQKRLGDIYSKGELGVKVDKNEAIKWYSKAAEQGDEEAKKRLKELGY